jgi:SAM-dependent methyltransferase
VDTQTIGVYNTNAAVLCARYRLIAPTELLQHARGFFHPGQPSADIGCGSGRDVAWLNAQGFPANGYDASPAMLHEARAAFPGIDVREAALPGLNGIANQAYANVLCSAVLMHLRREDLGSAVGNLARVLRPGGRLLLAYRSSEAEGQREADGRLFTAILPGELTLLLEAAGMRTVRATEQAERSIEWCFKRDGGAGILAGREMEPRAVDRRGP